MKKLLRKLLYTFFHSEAAGGIMLMIAAAAAMIIANSALLPAYNAFLNQTLTVGLTTPEGAATAALQKPLLIWINDLLMAIFFLLTGLEIKREIRLGVLSSRDRAILPLVAAVGGMAIPALIYMAFVNGQPQYYHGWAIPSATDIAFAVGVLALASSRIPLSVKVLLLAIAIIDDIGAILIIALFYAENFHLTPLLIAAVAGLTLLMLNRIRVTAYGPYFAVGFVLWVAVLYSGIHPTLAGVLMAFAIPTMNHDQSFSPLEELEHMLKPWVVFVILPLFGFANAGVSLDGIGMEALTHPVTLAIAMGLVIGKPIGIFGTIFLLAKARLCAIPQDATWRHILGISLLCGIGFTMALFIGALAFTDKEMEVYVRVGVMLGSLVAGVAGYLVLSTIKDKEETSNEH